MHSKTAAIAELAELVEDYLTHAPRHDVTMAALACGIAHVAAALTEAQRKSGDWGFIRGKLRSGRDALRGGLRIAELQPPPDVQGLLALGRRTLAFADLLDGEVERLVAGDSTLV